MYTFSLYLHLRSSELIPDFGLTITNLSWRIEYLTAVEETFHMLFCKMELLGCRKAV